MIASSVLSNAAPAAMPAAKPEMARSLSDHPPFMFS
jgi:hypothetical protein